MEILLITEGTSESAKAIGIRRAKGEVIGILASDNEIIGPRTLSAAYLQAKSHGACYPDKYFITNKDNSLNRYFALFGCNDPLALYMNKCDRIPLFIASRNPLKWDEDHRGLTVGDNGFFVQKSLIQATDLDNYYHIDNANEIASKITTLDPRPNIHYSIWHKTGGNILTFFAKRYRYGLQHAFNPNRRWHLVNFSRKEDICRLAWFIVASLTLIHPILTSIRGYRKHPDSAWFLHAPVCIMTVVTYGVLLIHAGCRRMFQSLFAPMVARSH